MEDLACANCLPKCMGRTSLDMLRNRAPNIPACSGVCETRAMHGYAENADKERNFAENATALVATPQDALLGTAIPTRLRSNTTRAKLRPHGALKQMKTTTIIHREASHANAKHTGPLNT